MTAQSPHGLFRSFLMGGFEGSTHRRLDGRQLDLIAATGHDRLAAQDYGLLASCGIHTVRDALRWHLIAAEPGRCDWSSALPMLRAAREAKVQVIWDLCHYGLPHALDIWSPSFIEAFAAFCAAAARVVAQEGDQAPIFCPVNEMSYWAWAGGDQGLMFPYAVGRGPELKRQLARAAIAGTRAARDAVPSARFILAEPLIHVTAAPDAAPERHAAAAAHRGAQFEVFDMVAGRSAPELGGSDDCLDLVGFNYYPENQIASTGGTIPLGHWLYRPLHLLLEEGAARYGRPLLLTETGADGGNGPGWLRYVMGEVRTAMRIGVDVAGVCLYPVMDYPGWLDDRHCRCGLLHVDPAWKARTIDGALLAQIDEEMRLFDPCISSRIPKLLAKPL